MTHSALDRIVQLSGFRILVLANRFGCDSLRARKVHDRLAAVLAEMIADTRNITAAERTVATTVGEYEKDEERLELYYYQSRFEEKWLTEAVPLLDDYIIDDATGEYFDIPAGRWFFREGDMPIIVPVPADALCGLATIIAEIEDATGTSFRVDNVYYTEAEAEAAWWETTGADPQVIFAPVAQV